MIRTPRKLGLTVMAIAATVMGLAGCSTTTFSQDKDDAYKRWSEARSGITYSLALQQFESGELDKAERTVNTAIAASPHMAPLYVLAGRIAMEQNELERAFHLLAKAIERDETDSEAHYVQGMVLQRWQQFDRALAAYERSYELDPDDPVGLLATAEMLVRLGRETEAIERLRSKLIYFEHSAAVRVSLGRIFLRNKQLSEALVMFREAQTLAPDEPALTEQLAMAEYAAGDFAGAIYHLSRLLRLDQYRGRRDLRTALADCYQAIGKPAESRRILLDLTREDPTDVDAWIKLGQASWIVGDQGRLREAAKQAFRLAPERFETHLLIGIVCREMDKQEEAVGRFERASELAPDESLPHLMRGMALESLGRVDEAEAAYQTARQLSPDDKRARRLLATMDRP